MARHLRRQISRMTIRARVAFGLVCAECVYKHLGLSSDFIDETFASLWKYTSAEDLEWWRCKNYGRAILESSNTQLSMKDCLLVCRVMKQLDEIGGGNLYGGFKNEFTLVPTLKLANLLDARRILLPPTRPFIQTDSRFAWLGTYDAWGRPFNGQHLRALAEAGANAGTRASRGC